MQSFELKFLGVTILQGVEFPIFLLIFEWALQQCCATALPVIYMTMFCNVVQVCLPKERRPTSSRDTVNSVVPR